jgi:hypothetical protein
MFIHRCLLGTLCIFSTACCIFSFQIKFFFEYVQRPVFVAHDSVPSIKVSIPFPSLTTFIFLLCFILFFYMVRYNTVFGVLLPAIGMLAGPIGLIFDKFGVSVAMVCEKESREERGEEREERGERLREIKY